MKEALIIIDVQEQLIAEKPYQYETFLNQLGQVIDWARQSEREIIFVRHQDDFLIPDTKDWQIAKPIEPMQDELVFDKTFNSAFKGTDLENYLNNKGIKNVILVGMQTEYCIDATVKVAFEKGFKVTIPSALHTTTDNSWMTAQETIAFYQAMWHGRYGQVISLQELMK